MDKLKSILSVVEGFLSSREAEFLYSVVSKGPKTIVEIGSLYGRSTCVMAQAIKDSNGMSLIYAIDPQYLDNTSYDKMRNNLNNFGLESYVSAISKTSEEAIKEWKGAINFLWIDGDHSFEMAEIDFLLWEPYLVEGGIIAYHDATFNYPGVRKAVSKYMFKSRKFKNAGFIDNIAFATKCSHNSLAELAANLYNLSLKNLVTSSARIKPPRFIKELVKPVVRKFSNSKLI